MTQEERILSELNEQQQVAVSQTDGPVMVLAGAGSGKTRVLTYRIAYMLAVKNISPYRILALTFTNKAAAEMRERIIQLVGGELAKAVTMGTFHSVFYRILRAEAERIGFNNNITIYDTDDAKSLIKSIVKEMGLDPKQYTPGFILSRISMAKSSLLSAQEYADNPDIQAADRMSNKPMISQIFVKYNDRLHKANAMDFDDLLYFMNVLLRDSPEALFKYQNRFNYILIDEYQDTNYAQYLIIKRLAALNQNICVVGDDAQSIYGFRGADIQNILNFKRDYPATRIFKLEQNYRSTQNIVNAANAVISHNKDRMPKEVWTDNAEGQKIEVIRASSDLEEANEIANKIFETQMREHVENRQFAILYRTNTQSRALEEAMVKRHIPYKIFGSISFYNRKEIKTLLAYFRLVINHYDEESLRRVINFPMRGIGDTSVARIAAAAQEAHVQMWDVLEHPENYNTGLNGPTMAKMRDFAALISGFSAQLTTKNAYELGMQIFSKTGFAQALNENIEEKERVDHVTELFNAIQSFIDREPENILNEETGEMLETYFPSLDQYMQSVSLLDERDLNKSEDAEEQNVVKLMTIHSAKGLEFDYVFVSGMEENLFPSSLSLDSRHEMEEERRLFYVALTRARKQVFLTMAMRRFQYGQLRPCEASRFMEEIPARFLNVTHKASEGSGLFGRSSEPSTGAFRFNSETRSSSCSCRRETPKSAAPAPRPVVKTQTEVRLDQIGDLAAPESIQPGVRVYHSKFGFGRVQDVSGSGPDARAVVQFDTVGTKTLVLKFAKLLIPK
ncbi:MAG: UvrD-helicase domain-containing protein [Bacteroidales bacterium]|jgi:DNA helicase-2/ATP-dependent DNA helicase PcrA|nr:UvrD-helicase domain-containing protein [Bacteroidales bacterium]